MDAEGNCMVDSATCAQWMAEGLCDSTDCVKMEGGKCYLKADKCMKVCAKSGDNCAEMKEEGCGDHGH
jgi:hypothetical protein